jgi:hypothetical protein
MEDNFRLKLKFWGVRGSIPTPPPENLGYGGSTTRNISRNPSAGRRHHA